MNKKKIFSYLFMIVFLFSFFSVEVKADTKELTCVYYNDKHDYAVMISQDQDGTGAVYAAKKTDVTKNGTINPEADWGNAKTTFADREVFIINPDINSDVNQILGDKPMLTCPEAIAAEKITDKKIDNMSVFFEIQSEKFNSYKKKNIVMSKKKSYNRSYGSNTESSDADLDKGNTALKKCDDVTDFWLNDLKEYASCVYSYDINNNCLIVQLDIDSSGTLNVIDNGSRISVVNHVYPDDVNGISVYDIKDKMDGNCPSTIYAEETKNHVSAVTGGSTISYNYKLSLSMESTGNWKPFTFRGSEGRNLNDGTIPMGVFEGFDINFVDGEKFDSCEDIFDEDGELLGILKMLIMIFKVAIPILLIVLGILDFSKAVFSSDEGNMKKIQSKFIKRVAIAVVIFLAPTLLKFILSIAENIWPAISSDLCGLL